MNFAVPLLQLLPRLISVYTRFLRLLEEERTALTQSQPGILEKCTLERANLVAALEAHDLELRTIFASAKIIVSSHAMKQLTNTLPEPQRSQLVKLWDKLLSIAAACKKQNAVNAKIVNTRRQYTSHVLRILTGKTTVAGVTYAADGRVQPGTASITLATA